MNGPRVCRFGLYLLSGAFLFSIGCASRGVARHQAAPKPVALTDPLEILRRVDAASKAVKAVSYDASFMGTGEAASRRPSIEGSVQMSGWAFGSVGKFYCHAKVQPPGSTGTKEITIGGNGDMYFVVDHAAKMAYEDMDPEVIGRTGSPARALLTLEFLHPTPFSDELNATKQELRGSKRIGGEDCYEIRVVYTGGQEAIWHFSKRDFLPRGRLDLRTMPSGERVGTQRFITNLVVDPQLDDSAFNLDLPPGFTKSDDFAP